MHTSSAVLLSIAMVCQTAVQAQEKEKYALVKREGVISIYERWITFPASNPPVKAREIKGEFFYHNTIYAGLRLLRNESKVMQWQNHLSEFKIYPERDTTMWLEYSYHDIPWPVSDQDHFMEYKLTAKRPGMLLITFKSKANKTLAPERDGVTRLELAGSWTLEQVSPGKVKATYKVISRPLDIPKIFTDPIVRNNIVTTIDAFIGLLEK
ncbi:MAG TPA: hypothetical protein VK666_10455 [Chryseolinea sp.]|nr:hypothetical protein [Chryseolinea sp.]